MIVQCPQCSSRCAVKQENIPAGGGRIRCPSCQHMYVVYPEPAPKASSLSGMQGMEDKTSVATNIKDLINRLNELDEEPSKSRAPKAQGQANVPDFSVDFSPDVEDGTVEMKNPYSLEESSKTIPPIFSEDAPTLEHDSWGSSPSLAETTMPELSAGPDFAHKGPWKIKSSLGIPMSFTDTESLKTWLIGRDDYNECEISSDGGQTYHPVRQFGQITGAPMAAERITVDAPATSRAELGGQLGPAPNPPQPAPSLVQRQLTPSAGIPAARREHYGAGDIAQTPRLPASPPHGPRILENTYQPPSRDAKWSKVLWVIFVVLTLACIGVGLHIANLVDFKALALEAKNQITGQPQAVSSPEAPKPPAQEPTVVPTKAVVPPIPAQGEPPPPAEAAEVKQLSASQLEQVDLLLEEAKRHIKNNKLATAEESLRVIFSLDEGHLEALDLLAKVYERTGRQEEARQAREKASKLRADSIQMDEEGMPSIKPN